MCPEGGTKESSRRLVSGGKEKEGKKVVKESLHTQKISMYLLLSENYAEKKRRTMMDDVKESSKRTGSRVKSAEKERRGCVVWVYVHPRSLAHRTFASILMLFFCCC